MRILADTCIFLSILYNEPFSKKAMSLLKTNKPIISVITLSEILASSYKKEPEMSIKAKALVERFVGCDNIISVTGDIAELAGKLKSKYSKDFSLADAIILATAFFADCDAIATFDSEFKKVEEIKIIGI